MLRTGIQNYLCVDWIFEVRGLFGFSFKDVPFRTLNEQRRWEAFSNGVFYFVFFVDVFS